MSPGEPFDEIPDEVRVPSVEEEAAAYARRAALDDPLLTSAERAAENLRRQRMADPQLFGLDEDWWKP